MLVGHTHFDHAVDAPAIARRFGCKAYGSRSLLNLMALHGLAERTVEVEPYRTYELGPFEVSFTPSVHSKLLLGLAVPYDGELSCEHLDSLSPGAYRCGQVWGISIAVAGLRFYHQGSANLIDEAIRERDVDVFLAGVAGRSFTDDYWQRILPRLNPRAVVPTHYDNFFRPLGQRPRVRRQRPARRAPRRDRRGQPRHRARRPAARGPARRLSERDAPTGAMAPVMYRAWRRSGRSCPWSACVPSPRAASIAFRSRSDSLMPPLGSQYSSRPSIARRSSSLASASTFLRAAAVGFLASSGTWSLPFEASTSFASNGSWAAIAVDLGAAAQEDRHLVAERLAQTRFDRASSAPLSLSPPTAAKITLPLARKVATSSKPSASNSARSSSFLIRRLPRFIPRRKAT